MPAPTQRQLHLLAAVLNEGRVDARQFRAAHAGELDELDALEADKHIVRVAGGRQIVSLIALDELRRRHNIVAGKIYDLCDQLLALLQRVYRSHQGGEVPIQRLVREAGLPETQVLAALEYLGQATLWRECAGKDSAAGGRVVLSVAVDERVLRFEGLGGVVADLRARRAALEKAAAGDGPPPPGRRKDDKFGILDSPRNLEADLKAPCGVLGRAVLFIDIDNFKAVNTALKEVVVDAHVLPRLHELISRCVEGHGYAYKHGGDEIVVLLTNASEVIAAGFAEAIRVRVAALAFEAEARALQLTVSIGIAQGALADDGALLLRRANEAKDVAKQGGRNRLALAGPEGFRILPHSG